jgi:uncharacterized membrane protein
MATQLKAKSQYVLLLFVALLFSTATTVMETLDVSSLLDTDQIFASANLLIAAVGAIVLIVVGFKLAALVIRWVLNIFDTLRFS